MDNLAGLLGELVDMFQALAPELWRILLRQAYVVAVQQVTWFFGCIGLLYIGKRMKKWALSEDDLGDTAGAVFVFSWALRISATLVAFQAIQTFISIVFNPEYYAIKSIIRTLTGYQ